MADNSLNITVMVAGRPYKLKVSPEEEALVRQTAKEINEKVQQYQEQFFSKDKQDFLAMIALQYRVDALKNSASGPKSKEWDEKLDMLEELLDKHI
jgi:cell division protein ZapA